MQLPTTLMCSKSPTYSYSSITQTTATARSIEVSPMLKFELLVFLVVLFVAGAAGGVDLDDIHRWTSSNMVVLKERRGEMEKIGTWAGLEARLVAAEARPRVITVSKDGSGDYRTLTAAVESIPAGNARRTIIRVGRGVYREKVTVPRDKPFLSFYGEEAGSADMPVITFDGTAAQYGTLHSATVAVESNHFMAVNIVFKNSAPAPKLGVAGAQAVALRISGDKAAFFNCRFYGYQDTLCDDRGKHFFRNCYIKGTVDFIFGNGRSIYLNCHIHSGAVGGTALTAQARETVADKSGFSFVQCTVDGSGSALLSRAWRSRSRVVFASSYLGSVVNPHGWDDMGHNERDRTVFYGEYNCTGPGASTNNRVNYAKMLTEKQAKLFISPNFIKARKWLLPPPLI